MKSKQRHGCLTAWLIYLLIAYSLSAIVYFSNSLDNVKDSEYISAENLRIIYGAFAILCVGFVIMLFKWLKLGFWGILTISAILVIVHATVGQGIVAASFVLVCLVVLYSLLQIKTDKVTGWNKLE